MRFRIRYSNMSSPTKAAFWFVISNIINKGISLLATPVLTRIMSPEEYGTFNVFQSWVAIVTIFCTLNLFLGAYSRGRLDFKGKEKQLESSLFTLTFLVTLIFFLVFCIAPEFWSRLMGLSVFLIGLLFAEVVLISGWSFWSVRQRFEYRYRALVLLTLFINVASLGFGIVAIMSSDAKVEARVISDVIAKAVPCVVLMVLILLRGRCFVDSQYWKYGISFSIPLIPHFLSHYILNQSDRLMISQMVGNSYTAIYSVSYSIAMTLSMVVVAINDSYSPYTYQELDKNKFSGIRSAGHRILLLVAVLTILVMAFAPEVLMVFAGPEYAEAVYIIPPLSASVFFMFLYSMMNNAEYFYKQTRLIAVASVIAALINVILNYIFIPRFGYAAAAWTTLAAYMALAFAHWYFSSYICKKRIGQTLYSAKYIGLAIIFILLATFGFEVIYDVLILRYAVVVLIVAVVTVKRRQILSAIVRKG